VNTAIEPAEKKGRAKAWAAGSAGPLLLALVISLTFLTIPRQPYIINDSFSEKAVMSYAHEQGLQFGSDMVFTYGPLGFLTSRYFFSHAATVRMAVDVLLCFAVAAGVCVLAWRLSTVWKYLLLGLFIWLAANIDPRTDLLLYIGLFCWGLLCLVESGLRLAFCAFGFAVLAAFGILVKGNFVFIAGISAAAIAFDLVMRGKYGMAAGLLAGISAGVILGWIAAGQNASHLGRFFANTFSIIRGYDQAVGLDGLQALRTRGLLTAVLAMGAAITSARTAFDAQDKRLRWRRGVLMVWLTSLVLLIWKHGFVRADLYHMGYLFGFAPILGLALALLPSEDQTARRWGRGFGLACCLVAMFALQSYFFLSVKSSVIQPFYAMRENLISLLKPAEYQQQMIEAQEAARRATDLPKLREIVGRSSVDVFGQEQCYALFNGMNYRPRPVFQSYLAYNARLMRLNEEFFLSKAAPDYVLFSLGPVDRKFPPLEDALVFRDLLINYELAGAEGPFLLLKSKSFAQPKLTLLREGTVRLGEEIGLDDLGNADLWMEISAEPTLAGRVMQLVYKPQKIRLAVRRESSKAPSLRFPAPAPMLAAGFLASPLLIRQADVSNLYAGNAVTRPKGYSVELLASETRLWQDTVRFRIYKIENKLGG